jgi:signal peptidase II
MMPSRSAARWILLALVLGGCVGCDQVTKQIAQMRLKGHEAITFWNDTVRLQYAENPGAFLGLGGQMPAAARWLVLVGMNALIATGIACMLLFVRQVSLLRVAACALLLAGALGNLIDRVRFDGLVIDFMNLGVGPLRTGIFNVADVAITTGALLLMWQPKRLTHAAPLPLANSSENAA